MFKPGAFYQNLGSNLFSLMVNAETPLGRFYQDNFGGSRRDPAEYDRVVQSARQDERSGALIRLAAEVCADRPATVLSLGMGAGFAEKALKLLLPRATVVGVDISLPACRFALQHQAVDIAAHAENLTAFDNDAFDIVLAGDLLEHLPDPEAYFSDIHRVLKPKGWVGLSTPNVSYFQNRLDVLWGKPLYTECDTSLPPWKTQHIRFFNFITLEFFLKKLNFKNIAIRGIREFQTAARLRKHKALRAVVRPFCSRNFRYQMMTASAQKQA